MSRTYQGKTTLYYYHGLTLMDTNQQAYLFGRRRFASLSPHSINLFHYDNRGDVTAMNHHVFHYGTTGLTSLPVANNAFYYASYLRDPISHLAYDHARSLKHLMLPGIGSMLVFTSADPSFGAHRLPSFLNAYLYGAAKVFSVFDHSTGLVGALYGAMRMLGAALFGIAISLLHITSVHWLATCLLIIGIAGFVFYSITLLQQQ